VEIDKSVDKKGKRESSTHSKREKRQRDENGWNETKRVGNGHILVNETLSIFFVS